MNGAPGRTTGSKDATTGPHLVAPLGSRLQRWQVGLAIGISHPS